MPRSPSASSAYSRSTCGGNASMFSEVLATFSSDLLRRHNGLDRRNDDSPERPMPLGAVKRVREKRGPLASEDSCLREPSSLVAECMADSNAECLGRSGKSLEERWISKAARTIVEHAMGSVVVLVVDGMSKIVGPR